MTSPALPAAKAACPRWCATHLADEDAVIHEGLPLTVDAAGGAGMVAGSVFLHVNRYDTTAATGDVAASINLTQNGVDLTAAELRQLAAAALNLADLIEVTR